MSYFDAAISIILEITLNSMQWQNYGTFALNSHQKVAILKSTKVAKITFHRITTVNVFFHVHE